VKLALTSPPVDGRANEELQRFFAELFRDSRSTMVLIAGEHTRDKPVLIAQRDGAAILTAIQQALASSNVPSSYSSLIVDRVIRGCLLYTERVLSIFLRGSNS
jgi:hypothetical protein